jgi:hypothetical protein
MDESALRAVFPVGRGSLLHRRACRRVRSARAIQALCQLSYSPVSPFFLSNV